MVAIQSMQWKARERKINDKWTAIGMLDSDRHAAVDAVAVAAVTPTVAERVG